MEKTMVVQKTLHSFLCSSVRRMLLSRPVSVCLFMVCVLGVAVILSRPVQADVSAPSPEEKTGPKAVLPPALDDAALKAGIASRIRLTRGDRDEQYRQFTPDLVEIEETIPVQIRGIAFFAVKIKLHAPVEKAKQEIITLIVDETGALQISGVYDLASGANLMQDAVNQLQHVDARNLPRDFGKEIFTGNGANAVTAVSDPFCPHCRKGWEYIKLHQNRLKTFTLSHFPLSPAAETACMVIADAHHRRFRVFDIVDFAYSRLQSAPDPQQILAQFMDAFPELATKWGPDPASTLAYLTQTFTAVDRKERSAAQALRISSTPVFFVNGTYIKGFHAEKMDNAMQ